MAQRDALERHKMKYGVYVPNFGDFAVPENLLGLARDAEAAGWDGFFLWDHLVFDQKAGIPVVDAWVMIAAIAAVTKRLRVGPLITPAARRRPWKLAREIVSLDHLSNGRAILGVGLGAPPEAEFQSFGEDPADRIRAEKLDEALTIIDGLSSGQPFQHQGQHFEIKEITFRPQPIQKPRVPIWVAAMWPNRGPLRRAARWDGVFPLKLPAGGLSTGSFAWPSFWLNPAELGEIIRFVSQYRNAAADPFDVIAAGATSSADTSKAAAHVKPFGEAGATWWLEWVDDQRGSLEEMRERVRGGPPKY
jgi:alkanesulfonate monooxygenase SsuD/methylene tetrahydromethanopterin reductase-like flavin-dependent oxidoreductase (luciferase family)